MCLYICGGIDIPRIEVNAVPSITDRQLGLITLRLAEVAAQELSGPEGSPSHLTTEDVEVYVRRPQFGDVNLGHHKLEITVFANDFPERRANIDERRMQIEKRLLDSLPSGAHGYIWIILAPASFGTFSKP